jgi:hypothetical protein
VCTVDRAVSSAHGSMVDRPFNTKGYAIRVARAISDGPGRTRAGCGGNVTGVWRRAARARRRCAWAAFPATNTTTGDACAHDRGVKGGDRASPAADAGWGWSGRSGELVSAPKCARRRETGRGLMLTV